MTKANLTLDVTQELNAALERKKDLLNSGPFCDEKTHVFPNAQKFRKRPLVVEAVQVKAPDFNGASFDGNPFSAMPAWLYEAFQNGTIRLSILAKGHTDYAEWDIKTLEGWIVASPGDWIIRDIKAELYPCKPDIFAENYEELKNYAG